MWDDADICGRHEGERILVRHVPMELRGAAQPQSIRMLAEDGFVASAADEGEPERATLSRQLGHSVEQLAHASRNLHETEVHHVKPTVRRIRTLWCAERARAWRRVGNDGDTIRV